MRKIYDFNELQTADLVIDAIYEGGKQGNAGDDPISKLIGCGNQGGFRYVGSIETDIKLCVLYSSLSNPDWPDNLDLTTGILTYYGDNKNPGRRLHDTRKKGNEILRKVFNDLHQNNRQSTPPFFVFTKGPKGRDVVFRGIAVPGAEIINQTEDLIAIWKTKSGERFQNYKSIFTILDCSQISHTWLVELLQGKKITKNTPAAWRNWIEKNHYSPLTAPKTVEYRKKNEQLPVSKIQNEIIRTIINYFKNHEEREYAFEKCAKEIFLLADKNIENIDLTRPWRDGGRDGLGKYRICLPETYITVEFALEAKCKELANGVGVRETSRLISRLRHRQFGVMITTSYVNEQAYREIIDDEHPVLIISAIDIVNILISAGYNNLKSVKLWLEKNF